MKKVFMALACVAVLASCNNAPKANDEKPQAAPTELKIAYVEVDSIMSQYNYAKDSQKALEQKYNNIQSTLASKQQQLQAAQAKLQQDYQANQLTQAQAQQRSTQIERQAQDLQVLNQRLTNEFQTATNDFNVALHDSIQNYLKTYNQDKKYSYILSKSGDNILLADKSYDITAEIIAGLNKNYKPAKKEVKKEEKK